SSFGVIILILVLTAWMHLGMLVMAVLFSYLAVTKLDFTQSKPKWPALILFLGILFGLGYGLTYLANATAASLPGIAEKAVPAVAQWAEEHRIALPFTDLNSL